MIEALFDVLFTLSGFALGWSARVMWAHRHVTRRRCSWCDARLGTRGPVCEVCLSQAALDRAAPGDWPRA